MFCYFKSGWPGNTWLTWNWFCLQDTQHRPRPNRAPLPRVLCCNGQDQLTSHLSFWSHVAAQENAHGKGGINPFKTKGMIQLWHKSVEEADSKKVIKVGKFCTFPVLWFSKLEFPWWLNLFFLQLTETALNSSLLILAPWYGELSLQVLSESYCLQLPRQDSVGQHDNRIHELAGKQINIVSLWEEKLGGCSCHHNTR